MLGDGLGRVERGEGFVQLREEEEEDGGLLGFLSSDNPPPVFFNPPPHQQQKHLPSFFLMGERPPDAPSSVQQDKHLMEDLLPPPSNNNLLTNVSEISSKPSGEQQVCGDGRRGGVSKEDSHHNMGPSVKMKSNSTILGSFKDSGGMFVERLKSIGSGGTGLPSSEEFVQFERMYYGQVEEVRVLKEKFSCSRLAVLQLEEEKRSLEMRLVSERAEREGEERNAQAELERVKIGADNAVYAVKAETDTWKRRTEAAQQEVKWLKDQLRTLEMEKIDALRKLGEVREKSDNAVQYGTAIEAYAGRQKEVMAENKRGLIELEKSRDVLAKIVEGNSIRMREITAHMKLENKARKAAEVKTEKVEAELISTRATLVQERGELHRCQTAEARKTDLLQKVVAENTELHTGIEILLSSLEGKLDLNTSDFMKHVNALHKETQSAATRINLKFPVDLN